MSAVIGILFIVVMIALAMVVVGGSVLVLKRGIEAIIGWIKRIPA